MKPHRKIRLLLFVLLIFNSVSPVVVQAQIPWTLDMYNVSYGHYTFDDPPESFWRTCHGYVYLPTEASTHLYGRFLHDTLQQPITFTIYDYGRHINYGYGQILYSKNISGAEDTIDVWIPSGVTSVYIKIDSREEYRARNISLELDVCHNDRTNTIWPVSWHTEGREVTLSWSDNSGADFWEVDAGWIETKYHFETSEPEVSFNMDSLGKFSGMDTTLTAWVRIFNNTTSTREMYGCDTRPVEFPVPCIEDVDLSVDFTQLSTCNSQAYVADYLSLVSDYYGLGRQVVPHYVPEDESSKPNDFNIHHAINYDRLAYDPNLEDGALLIIPKGETKSVRIGTMMNGGNAAKVCYRYQVDTNLADMLLLRYASVMQNPSHEAYYNPRVLFTFYDENMQPVDSNCLFFTFVADANLGWNTYGQGYSAILWKDWTPVGVDLTPLHGQTIYVQISTQECGASAHYAYIYYTFQTLRKSIKMDACGYDLVSECKAPDGFDYSWYEASSPSQILSTSQVLHITDPGDYRCFISYKGSLGGTCGVEMRAYTAPHFPHAQFSVDTLARDHCSQKYRFINQSSTFADDDFIIDLNVPCDSFYWDFGDGTTSTEEHPIHIFSAGVYPVTLTAMLNGGCSHTDTMMVVAPDFNGYLDTTEYVFFHQLPHSFSDIQFSHAVEDTIIMLRSVLGCDSIITYTLRIIGDPVVDELMACPGEFPLQFHGITFSDYATIDTMLYDSTAQLYIPTTLIVYPAPTSSEFVEVVVCYGEPVEYDGHVFTDEGDHLIHYTTPQGCDSVVNVWVHYNRDCTDIWFPNTITPNEPTNRCFRGVSSDLLESETWIYDRNGILVAHLPTKDDCWNPLDAPTPVPQGAYTYKTAYRLGSHPGRHLNRVGTVLVLY